MTAFKIRSMQVKMKVCQYSGTYIGLAIAAAANIIAAQAGHQEDLGWDHTIINTGGGSNLTEEIAPTRNPL